MVYGTWRLNAASQQISSNSCTWAELTQFLALISISLRSILTLSSQLSLGLPRGVFPVGIHVQLFDALLPSSIVTTCPVHLNLLDLLISSILLDCDSFVGRGRYVHLVLFDKSRLMLALSFSFTLPHRTPALSFPTSDTSHLKIWPVEVV